MPRCRIESVRWKQRRAFRLSNDKIELIVLLGGGHIADIRLVGSPINALWEAPWPTIEPYQFSDSQHAALYGERSVGQMLSGYTGHALALGYFGMPSPGQAMRGLSLHGEAASAEWNASSSTAADEAASLTLEVELPLTEFHFRRTLKIAADAPCVAVEESVTNRTSKPRDLQWVQHAAFGEPLLSEDASLALSGGPGLTWPLGYEGHELLPNDLPFTWPIVSTPAGTIDLSQPFVKEGTGFVAAVRTDSRREDAFIAVHNRDLALAAGYLFDARRFPWIVLWEENRARPYPPWNGVTRVRGVEFGTSPMPLGLEHAEKTRTLLDTPALASIAGDGNLSTAYEIFVTPVPPQWNSIRDVARSGDKLVLHGDSNSEFEVSCS